MSRDDEIELKKGKCFREDCEYKASSNHTLEHQVKEKDGNQKSEPEIRRVNLKAVHHLYHEVTPVLEEMVSIHQ